MTYDSFVTAAVAREAQTLVGGFVDHIAQPAELDLHVTFYVGGRKARWVFSADARAARVHQVAGKPDNPPTPPGFCMLLRKWIEGAKLTAVHQVGFDRVLRWQFSRSDGNRSLVAEVMGKHSNLILLDEADVVLGAIKRVPAAVSRVRQVLPGLTYAPPPGDRLDPLSAAPGAISAALAPAISEEQVPGSAGILPASTCGQDARAPRKGDSEPDTNSPEHLAPPITSLTPADLVRSLSGFGTFAAAEALARAGSGEPEAVGSAVAGLAGAVREGRFEPTLFLSGSTSVPADTSAAKSSPAAPRGFWAFRSVQTPPDQQQPTATMSEAADRFYSSVQRAGVESALRGSLLGAVRKERERLERLARRLSDDLRRGDEVEQWKIAGELLAANLWRVERGQTSVEVPNYYEPEQRPLTIALDSERTPQENVERLFRRYRKGTDAALQAMEQSGKISTRLAEAREWEERLGAAPVEELPRLQQALAESGLLPTHGAPATSGERKSRDRAASEFPSGVRIRRYLVEGWEVLLGENATSNDYLTTKVARPDDWWLHVRAAPSSHVVIRTGGQPDRVPPTVLHEAARITAAHSESKHSSYVPVDYVLKKHVRKPRGSAPGLVTHRGEKTLYVEPATGSVTR